VGYGSAHVDDALVQLEVVEGWIRARGHVFVGGAGLDEFVVLKVGVLGREVVDETLRLLARHRRQVDALRRQDH